MNDPMRLDVPRPRVSDINPDVPSGMAWIAAHVSDTGRITYTDLLAAWCQGVEHGRAETRQEEAQHEPR